MIVISNTSPLNYLAILNLEEILPTLYGRILVPPAVVEELQSERAPPTVRAWVTSPPG